MVARISLGLIPTFLQAAASMSIIYCGKLGLKVLCADLISGRAVKAAVYCFVTSKNFSRSPPVLSCMFNSISLDAEYPGIIGGVKNSTCASFTIFCARMNKLPYTISELCIMERSSQSFNLIMNEPYEGPWPPIKLKPIMAVRDLTAGSAAIRLSTLFITSIVRSWDVPGGSVTAPMIVPVSSFGTIPVGVAFIKTTSKTIHPATIPNESHFFWIKNTTRFL